MTSLVRAKGARTSRLGGEIADLLRCGLCSSSLLVGHNGREHRRFPIPAGFHDTPGVLPNMGDVEAAA
jgi:hypothetical protein